jgi:hypothetical protein
MDADVNNVPENLQMEIIEIQADLVLKSQFNNIALTDFYILFGGRKIYKFKLIFKKNHLSFRQHIYV